MASSRVKHIDIRHHFVRDHINLNDIKLEWISTAEQQADIFTKALGKNVFLKLRSLIMGHQLGVEYSLCTQSDPTRTP